MTFRTYLQIQNKVTGRKSDLVERLSAFSSTSTAYLAYYAAAVNMLLISTGARVATTTAITTTPSLR